MSEMQKDKNTQPCCRNNDEDVKDNNMLKNQDVECCEHENTQNICVEDNNNTTDASSNGEQSNDQLEEFNNKINALSEQLKEKTTQAEQFFSMLQRTAAEFDNYKKRANREKESLYSEAVADVVAAFLPVADNLDRALKACKSENHDFNALKDGVEMVIRQFNEILSKLGVVEIKALGEKFDPNLHNAVMHVEDDTVGENTIVEEFQKGYMYKEKVIRYSMVKVAN